MKTLIFLVLAGIFSLNILAQVPMRGAEGGNELSPQQKERIESMRIAFITSKLELRATQAEKFWPRYHEYYAQKEAVREDLDRVEDAEVMKLSEREASEKLEKVLHHRQKELDMDKKFYHEMEEILSTNQVLALSRVDGQFRRHMLRQARSASGHERIQQRQQHKMQREQQDRGQRNK